MSYKIARGRVPTSPFDTPTRITTNTISSRPTDQRQPQNQSVAARKPRPARTRQPQTPTPATHKNHQALQRLSADELPHDRRRWNRRNLIRRKRHDIIQELQETNGLGVGRRRRSDTTQQRLGIILQHWKLI